MRKPLRRSLRTMSRNPELSALVSALTGTWMGQGKGGYPTIQPFTYREETTVSARGDHPDLQYEQRTWRQTAAGEVVSHWETGFLRLSSDHTASMINAQSGRAETMIGTWEHHDGEWHIELASTAYAGDDRVANSTRALKLDDVSLTYEMQMETNAIDAMGVHLSADLSKQS